jgi:cobalamin biosynthesis protein CobT
MGTPEDVDPYLHQWNHHEEKPKTAQMVEEENAISVAVVQGLYFTKPSEKVGGVREHRFGQPITSGTINYSRGWQAVDPTKARRTGKEGETDVAESIIQPAVLHTRRAFSDNQRGAQSRNRKSGNVDARVLGKRAWDNNPRLFQKNQLPGKKDWFVVIGVDVSGSTTGLNLLLIKRAVKAQAEMLDRVGVPFAIYAHTGGGSMHVGFQKDLDMYVIKEAHERWDDKTKIKLETIGASGTNLDGHALEYLRKKADESRATNKVILYYSDGKMPASNHDEELAILQSEIKLCHRKGYILLGVGIRTDSPREHGLDTIQVDTDDDLIKVVKHLSKRLSNEA